MQGTIHYTLGSFTNRTCKIKINILKYTQIIEFLKVEYKLVVNTLKYTQIIGLLKVTPNLINTSIHRTLR